MNRDKLSSQIPAAELTTALTQAAGLMQQKQKPVMTPEMLLWAFLQGSNCRAQQILRHLSQRSGFSWPDLVAEVTRLVTDQRPVPDIQFDFVTAAGDRIPLGNELLILLDEGLSVAEKQGEDRCHTGHLLAAMTKEAMGTAWPLHKRGIQQEHVLAELGIVKKPLRPTRQPPPPPAPVTPSSAPPPTEPRPLYIRTELLHDLISRLSITQGRHIILLGPAGVGKRALVHTLAQHMAKGLGPSNLNMVVEIDEQALLDDPLAELQQGLRLARNGILFIPDIARFFGGLRADFPETAGNALQKAFLSNEVVIIGSSTEVDYKQKLQPSSIVMENSQRLVVPPTTVEETIAVLEVWQPQLETDYKLTIAANALAEAARLAARYYTVQPLPGAAIYLLHRTCGLLKANQKLVQATTKTVTSADVMTMVNLLTNIPVTHLGTDERDRYLNMEAALRKRIVGQQQAVSALSQAVKMARVGLKDPQRPIGSFLFLGPTGVGKTELAKALAEFMFGTEAALIVLDMSEYMEDSTINRLIGSPPGYVGHEAGGQLTSAVKQKSYSVVLFDEVEKASVKVFDALLQVMEEGRLTSGQGEQVSFSQAVILMTSNIGGMYLSDLSIEQATRRALAESDLRKHFRPEFLNRLDDIIFFHPLTDDNLRDILNLMLTQEQALLAERGWQLSFTEAAKSWLLAQNEHPEWGGRPLRRIIQRHVRQPIADYILQHDPAPETEIKVRVRAGELLFEMNEPPEVRSTEQGE